MFIKFHRGITHAYARSGYKRTAIIVDAEGTKTIDDIFKLDNERTKFDLDISYVDVIVTDRVAQEHVIDALATFGIHNEGERQTTPMFKFAVFNPRALPAVQLRASMLKQKLKEKSLLSVEDLRYGSLACEVEIPAVSYVGARDYISSHLASRYDTIISVGENTDIYSLSNILKNYDYVGAEMWT